MSRMQARWPGCSTLSAPRSRVCISPNKVSASRLRTPKMKKPGFTAGRSCSGGYFRDWDITILLLRRGGRLGNRAFDRLVGLLGEIGIEFADLRRLGDEALIGVLVKLGLHFERLVERLGAEQFF